MAAESTGLIWFFHGIDLMSFHLTIQLNWFNLIKLVVLVSNQLNGLIRFIGIEPSPVTNFKMVGRFDRIGYSFVWLD